MEAVGIFIVSFAFGAVAFLIYAWIRRDQRRNRAFMLHMKSIGRHQRHCVMCDTTEIMWVDAAMSRWCDPCYQASFGHLRIDDDDDGVIVKGG